MGELEGKKEVKLFIHETEVVLKPTRAYTLQNKEYEILVDGQRIEIRPNERKVIPTKSSSVILKLIRSPDDVLILETPYLRVIYDGELVEVKETSILIQRDLKGLCGTNNGDQRNDVLTPTVKIPPHTKLLLSPIELESLAHLLLNNSRYTKSNCVLPSGKVLASASLKSLFSSVVLDALQGPW